MFDIKCEDCGNYYKGSLLNCPFCPPPKKNSPEVESNKSDLQIPLPPPTPVDSQDTKTGFKGIGYGAIIIGMAGFFFLILMFTNYNTGGKSTSTHTPTTIPAKTSDIPQKDGTYEKARGNDLEELCKDYVFYRNKILKANAEGNTDNLIKYRASLNQIDHWLNEYRHEDVADMVHKVEQEIIARSKK